MKDIAIAMNVKTRRPGCVNIQAAFGCTDRDFFMKTFDSQHWEVGDIDNIRLIRGTPAQWRRHAELLDEQRQR